MTRISITLGDLKSLQFPITPITRKTASPGNLVGKGRSQQIRSQGWPGTGQSLAKSVVPVMPMLRGKNPGPIPTIQQATGLGGIAPPILMYLETKLRRFLLSA